MIWVPFHVKMRNCQKHDFSTQMSDFNILPAEFSNDSRVLLRLEAILSRLWSIAELGFEAEVVEVATRPICSSFCPGKLANLKIFGAEFWSGLFVFRVFSPFEGLKGISCLRKRALERENKKILSFFSVKIFTFFFFAMSVTYVTWVRWKTFTEKALPRGSPSTWATLMLRWSKNLFWRSNMYWLKYEVT